MSLGRRRRFAVLERDDFTCQYCGRRAPSVLLEVDHIMPVSHGGSDHPDNLVTACEDCNRGKAAVWDTRGYFDLSDRLAGLEKEYFGAIRRIAALEAWVADRTDNWTVRQIGRADEE